MNILLATARLCMALAVLLMAPLLAGCQVEADEEAHVGSIEMNLVTTTSTGNTYRLDGEFAVANYRTGELLQVVDSNLYPEDTTLNVELAIGEYAITIQNWTISKLVDGAFTEIDGELLSGATQYVNIVEGETSSLNYLFEVVGDSPAFGGTLEVSASIYEDNCADDVFEDDDSLTDATGIFRNSTYWAKSCPYDEDFFRVPVIVGANLRVQVNFTVADGNLDVLVYDENGSQIASGYSLGDNEVVEVPSFPTANAYILVTSFGGEVENNYSLVVSLPPPTGWTCPNLYFADNVCDCGCSVADLDCGPEITTPAQCAYNNCAIPTPNIDPTDLTQCIE